MIPSGGWRSTARAHARATGTWSCSSRPSRIPAGPSAWLSRSKAAARFAASRRACPLARRASAMARTLPGAPARPRAIMARGVRLPRTAGRPPRFLRTGHRRATSLNEAHLQPARRDAGHTLGREAEGVLQTLLFHRASRGPASAKGDIPRPGRGRPRPRRGARFRGELPAAAEVADAAPATALRPEGPCCAAAALPRLSGSGHA